MQGPSMQNQVINSDHMPDEELAHNEAQYSPILQACGVHFLGVGGHQAEKEPLHLVCGEVVSKGPTHDLCAVPLDFLGNSPV